MISHFDHVFTFASQGRLDQAIDTFRHAGFVIYPERIRHVGGKLSGFAMLTGSYLEVIAVIDEEEFQRTATAMERHRRQAARPYAVAAAVDGISRAHQQLLTMCPDMAPIEVQHVHGDEDGPPGWAIVRPPRETTPGADLFLVEYLRRKRAPVAEVAGENGIFAIGGFYFCSLRGADAASRWTRLLAPVTPGLTPRATKVALGLQTLHWISPGQRAAIFGEKAPSIGDARDELCGVQLFTTSLQLSRTKLTGAGFAIVSEGVTWFSTKCDDSTGYAFVVEERHTAAEFGSSIDRRRSLV
jgi:hypothetical protein